MQSQHIECRYTTALPTNAEIANNPDLLVSDHTPALFDAHGITGITWNVLDPAYPSGYDHQESDEQVSQRRLRILNSLKRMIDANKGVDVILLQESGWLGGDFLKEFEAMGWSSPDSVGGNIVLFNPNFKIRNVDGVSSVRSEIFGDVTRISFNLKNMSTVSIMNVQSSHADLPLKHKEEIEKILALEDKVIVAGDFNIRIAPEHSNPQNIITGLVPKRYKELSGACNWTDGAFAGGKNLEPTQCPITLLDPQSGGPAEVIPSVFESDEQKAQVSRMWPCINIGVSPYAEFVQQLRKKLAPDNQNIHVFTSSNAMNHKGVMIAYSKNEKVLFDKLFAEVKGIDRSGVDGDRGRISLASMNMDKFAEVREWLLRQNSQIHLPVAIPQPALESMRHKLTIFEKNPNLKLAIIGALIGLAVLVAVAGICALAVFTGGAPILVAGAASVMAIGSVGFATGLAIAAAVTMATVGGLIGYFGSKAWNKHKATQTLSNHVSSSGVYTPVMKRQGSLIKI